VFECGAGGGDVLGLEGSATAEMVNEAVVQTSAGRVSGAVGAGVLRFVGVPYAAPPVGARRFRPPAPPPPWEGVLPCTDARPACPQTPAVRERYRPLGGYDEDCLTLNIWTPALDDAKRPVVLFLHGGGFTSGSGTVGVYDSRHFAEHGVVGVTCNYRLATLGFLHLDELFDGFAGSGNNGLLDQIAALEWIAENIARFGGDPGNVTIYGSSAGGISVCALMASARARGLFTRAVPISCAAGIAFSAETATAVARTVLERAGVRPGDLDALYATPLERFVGNAEMIREVMAMLRDRGVEPAPFLPVVDGHLLERDPFDAVSAGEASGIDLLIGVTGEESGARHSAVRPAIDAMRLAEVPTFRPDPDAGFDFTRLFGAGCHEPEIVSAYESSLRHAGRPHERADLYALAHADVRMLHPTMAFAAAHARHHRDTWAFRFVWPSPAFDGALGAFHGVTTPFLFANLDAPGWEPVIGADPPRSLGDDVHGAIVSFAAGGVPVAATARGWERYDGERHATMLFDAPVSRPVVDPEAGRRRVYETVAIRAMR